MSDGFITNKSLGGAPRDHDWSVVPMRDPGDGKTLGISSESGQAFERGPPTPSSNFIEPSLSGPEPGFGRSVKGIGGSDVSAAAVSPTGPHATRPLTEDDLMKLANQMEQDLMERTKASEGTTAVDPALIRSGGGTNPYGGTITPDAPDWLVKYMEGQPTMGVSQSGGPGEDKVKAKKFLSQQEMLKHLKSKSR